MISTGRAGPLLRPRWRPPLARQPDGPPARPPGCDSPGLGPHTEQVAAAGGAGDPHGPVVLAVAPRLRPSARAPAAAGGPPRPHAAAGPARLRPLPALPAPARQARAAGRLSRPRLTRAPIYSPGPGRHHLLLSLPRPGPATAASEAREGAGPRGAQPEGPTRGRRLLPSADRPTCVERPLGARSHPGRRGQGSERPRGARAERGRGAVLEPDGAYAPHLPHRVSGTQASRQPSFPTRPPVLQMWKVGLCGLWLVEGAERPEELRRV